MSTFKEFTPDMADKAHALSALISSTSEALKTLSDANIGGNIVTAGQVDQAANNLTMLVEEASTLVCPKKQQ